ncbi:STAS domain-containing protein [Streptomyces sp. NPDC002130]|uniref:STAS domain-containing protein n=1 Tax=Streptomyces sp. NPDC002130 TaxID=3155568 RepID=UPI00331ACC96
MAEGHMTDPERAEQAPRPVGLSVLSTATDGVRVLTLAGEIDRDTGDRLRQALNVSDTARRRIVVDMRQVTFMDSTGINILIAAYQAVTAAGGWIRLAGPAGSVMRTLQIVGVDDVIDCRADLREALGP